VTNEVLKDSSSDLRKINSGGPHKNTFLNLLVLAAAALSPLGSSAQASSKAPGRVLLVVAHPDDEYYFAATTYRIAVELHGTVDELVITNGEGGFHYSTLAEPYYDKALTTEAVGRKELPAIRREETLNAGRILGIQDHYFLGQKDEMFTTNENEGLNHLWDTAFITHTIADLIYGKHYQYVFTVLPRSSTHGHHQAATILALRAVESLPDAIKPVVLGFDTDGAEYRPAQKSDDIFGWTPTPSFAFNRDATLGFHHALNYQMVVSWMIAEHKSQGMLQTMYNKNPNEYIWVARDSTPDAETNATSLFRLLASSSVQSEAAK
jgi:LmbE family N-acetylglucosaminyl deacetylase